MPISWKGTLQQYVGRPHRLHDAQRVVEVYDHVDGNIPMLARMYGRRLKGRLGLPNHRRCTSFCAYQAMPDLASAVPRAHVEGAAPLGFSCGFFVGGYQNFDATYGD